MLLVGVGFLLRPFWTDLDAGSSRLVESGTDEEVIEAARSGTPERQRYLLLEAVRFNRPTVAQAIVDLSGQPADRSIVWVALNVDESGELAWVFELDVDVCESVAGITLEQVRAKASERMDALGERFLTLAAQCR